MTASSCQQLLYGFDYEMLIHKFEILVAVYSIRKLYIGTPNGQAFTRTNQEVTRN